MGNKKITFTHSMRMKIVVGEVLGTLFTCAIIMFMIISMVNSTMSSMTKNSMAGLVSAYADLVEQATSNGAEQTYEVYREMLGSAKLAGVDSSYIYMVDENGTMLYHPTEEKVGQPVENVVVKGLVSQLSGGVVPKPDTTEYEFKGTIKYAAYQVLSNRNILVLSADESDVFSGLNRITKNAVISGVLALLVVLLFNFFYSGYLMKPLVMITDIIREMAQLRFVNHPENERLLKRRDECGAMANAVAQMRDKMKVTVSDINSVSSRLTDTVDRLRESSNEINASCTDNSATTQQLAAGMEETTASAQDINASIGKMKHESGEIQNLSKEGEALSDEIRSRADQLKASTDESVKAANQMFRQVKEDTQKAIEEAKAVDKINELTNVIMEISSQTSLLALNASIEAARAGEAGRGFSVVASEIGNLADQTSQTVGNINKIVEDVNHAVSNMVYSMNKTTDYMEKSVLPDYDGFNQVINRYAEDAQTMKSSMNMIQHSIVSLNDTIRAIAANLEGINDTISESANGVNDIAEKTTDVVGKTADNERLVETCQTDADGLKEIAQSFYLE